MTTGPPGPTASPTNNPTPPPTTFTPTPTPIPTPTPTNYAALIYNAAVSYEKTPTSGGPSCPDKLPTKTWPGECACVWAIQNILANAGLARIANNTENVPDFEGNLPLSGYIQVSQVNAVPGDFVIQGDDSHMGVCINAMCTSVISNASGPPPVFDWTGDPYFSASYSTSAPAPRFYHHQ